MSALTINWFEVNSECVIIDPEVPEPTNRAQVFERVDPTDAHDLDGLIDLIWRCPPLAQHFQGLGEQYLQENTGPQVFLHNLVNGAGPRTGSHQLILRALRQDPDDGWERWIELSGDGALEGFRQVVRDWLTQDIDRREREYFDSLWNGQLAALGHFEDQSESVLKAIGVRVIDGDCPGSTYRAAELHKAINDANQAAESLGLDCRFRASPPRSAI